MLHVVSELKVTRPDMNFEKLFFKMHFIKKSFQKYVLRKVFSREKLILESITPRAIYLSFDSFVLNLSFFVSACLKHLRYQRVFMYPVGFVNISRLGPPPQVQEMLLLLLLPLLLASILLLRYVRTLEQWVENLFTGRRHLLKLVIG